jgi:hypothetical protein
VIKVNLKQFFTPNWRKIILFILLFLLVPFPIYVAKPVCPAAIGYECKPHWTITPFVLTSLVGTGTVSEESIFFSFGFFKEHWFYVLINLVWSYFLACLIIRIYEKVVKR